MSTSELSVIACRRAFSRGRANGTRRSRRIAPVETSAPTTPPHTSVQYRNPTTAKATMLIASTSAWLRSRSEEHTSELQSLTNLVCRLLLEKKKQHKTQGNTQHHTN